MRSPMSAVALGPVARIREPGLTASSMRS
jgi:hypothetical protein